MAKRLFVGGISYSTTNEQLAEFFAQYGKVESVNVITDKYTGQGKGFGFVEMATEEDAQKAMQQANGQMLGDRKIAVNEARPQENRGDRSGSDNNFRRPRR